MSPEAMRKRVDKCVEHGVDLSEAVTTPKGEKMPSFSRDISSVRAPKRSFGRRDVSNTFVARNVRLATAGVLIHVEDRRSNNDAAMEGFGTSQQKRMKYAG